MLAQESNIDRKLVKAYNTTCELWQIMDQKMDRLLQTEREKKHLSNNIMAAMHLEKLTKADKRETLGRILRKRRRLHIMNIQELEERMLEEVRASEESKRGESRSALLNV